MTKQADRRPSRGAVPIASRDDVLHSLDRILGYYRQHEPSNPVPVLLARARTLVNADFAEIVRNLIPDGLALLDAHGWRRPPSIRA